MRVESVPLSSVRPERYRWVLNFELYNHKAFSQTFMRQGTLRSYLVTRKLLFVFLDEKEEQVREGGLTEAGLKA